MAKVQDMMPIARKRHIDHEMGQVVGGKHILYVFQVYMFLKTFVVIQMRTRNLFSPMMRVKRTRHLPDGAYVEKFTSLKDRCFWSAFWIASTTTGNDTAANTSAGANVNEGQTDDTRGNVSSYDG